jgi:hypothetical protein
MVRLLILLSVFTIGILPVIMASEKKVLELRWRGESRLFFRLVNGSAGFIGQHPVISGEIPGAGR